MILAAVLLTVAVSIPPPVPTAYHPELTWCSDSPLPGYFSVERAPAFTHPYQWAEVVRLQLSDCPVVTATTVRPWCPVGQRACKWTGPQDSSPVYYWHRLNGTVEPGRYEVTIAADPLP